MDAKQQARLKEKNQLLSRLAELMIEEQTEQGVFLETPHYSIIERQAATLGRQLSQQAQARAAREVAACCDSQVPCPDCQTVCQVQTKKRQVQSIDGNVQLTEPHAHCPRCRRDFFPSTPSHGIG